MKVYLGPYRDHISPLHIASKILFWKDVDSNIVLNFANLLQKIGVDNFCNLINANRSRKIKVRIDNYDTWGMDHTLALIILPMLKQLKATKHGSPFVEQNDLPDELRFNERELLVFSEGRWNEKLKATEEEIDAVEKKFHSQWAWVLDQMIWSFENHEDGEDEYHHYYDPYLPNEPLEEEPKSQIIHENGTTEDAEPLFDDKWRRKMGKFNSEKYKTYQDRKYRGFVLFGKYYQNLWD